MKISSSSIGMESERLYTTVRMDAHLRSQSMRNVSPQEFYDSLNNNLEKGKAEKQKKNNCDEKNEEDNDPKLNGLNDSLNYLKGKFNELSNIKPRYSYNDSSEMLNKFRVSVIKYLLLLLLGEDARDLFELSFGNTGGGSGFVETTETDTYMEYYSEEETTTYKAAGKVITEDGRELDFGIDLCMSRSFEEYYESTTQSTSIKQMLMDPLVINFNGNISDIGDQKFYFDLDSDGMEDKVSMIGNGSGFLALDKNDDGIINDGNELFGTKSGDGFKDLSMYDEDGNGWIDENDSIFDKLKIMTVNEDGSQTLYKLKDKDVGAIYLGNVSTDFLVTNNDSNKVNAAIRKTGLFLYESGSAGTIQHVDLAVELGA